MCLFGAAGFPKHTDDGSAQRRGHHADEAAAYDDADAAAAAGGGGSCRGRVQPPAQCHGSRWHGRSHGRAQHGPAGTPAVRLRRQLR